MRLPFPYRRGTITGILLLCVVLGALWVDGNPGDEGDGDQAGGAAGQAGGGIGAREAGGAPAAAQGAAGRAAGRGGIEARVVEVTDGDTIKVVLAGGRTEDVRYIGVDTPESVDPDQPVQCFAHRAARVNRRLVGGRRVRLVFDRERRDVYGRLLAYVRRGPVLVNAALVRRGLARTLTIPPNDSLAPLLGRLEMRAARAGRGLWSACGP